MIVHSVLNRLSADSSTPGKGTPEGRAGVRPGGVTKAEFEKYRAAVRQDLEWLLNTRRNSVEVPEGLKEVEKSVYVYGLPDYSQLNLCNDRGTPDQDRLAAMIARTIELFEPRLMDIRVTIGARGAGTRDLRFHVVGRLRMKPRPEPVCYDTTLDVTRGEYTVGVVGEGRA